MKRSKETLWYSAGGVIALFVILVAATSLRAFTARVDLTEGDVYTLSPGTRSSRS